MRIKRVFHPTDFSEASEIAFAHALMFTLMARSRLSLMHVAAREEGAHWKSFPSVRETLERWQLLPPGSEHKDLARLGIGVSKIINKKRDPVDSVLDYLQEHHAQLVVLATHQYQGRSRWMHKPVAEPIARHYHDMTLFIPHGIDGFVSLRDGSVHLRNIVIPVDHEPDPQPAVDTAIRVAEGLGCDEVTFTLLHAGGERHMPALHHVEKEGWTWNKRTATGAVLPIILETARTTAADLVVMTTAGHHGFLDALRGSTTEQVLRHTPCPLLAVPAGE